jgi:TonB family protein
VKPGNQTELNTRASPFAAFITTMHRQIHELWGFGALADWDSKPSSNRYNDESLWVKMEIVLNPDGSVDRVGVVRTSGYTPFDAAAVDVVWSAGPYPAPPGSIRSGNGKIYLHWSFHRDARQCATAWADPFILDNAGQDLVAGRRPGAPGGGGAGAARGGSSRRGDSVSPEARQVAASWFAALGRRDVQAMSRLSGFPFRSGSEVVATTGPQLQPLFQHLMREASGTDIIGPEMLTPAAARLALGRLPPAVNENPELAFALGQVGDQRIVLALARQRSEWKAIGLFLR